MLRTAIITTLLLVALANAEDYNGYISSIKPTAGGILGGTRITILGNYFDMRGRSNNIYIGDENQGAFCDPIPNECHETRIVCITAPFQGRGVFPLRVIVGENPTAATCRVSSGCTFSYDMDKTPTITGVSPQWITTPQSITVTGAGFDRGDGTQASFDMYIYLGDEERCDLGSNPVNYGSLVCEAQSGIFPGPNRLSIMFGSRGWAIGSNTYDVLVVPSYSSISVSSGSTEGGQEVTIKGTSFSRALPENSITIHGSPCVPTRVTELMIVCTTTAHPPTTTATLTYARGAYVEYWKQDVGTAGSVIGMRGTLDFLSPEYTYVSESFSGDAVLKYPSTDSCAIRVTAYFIPTENGNHSFSARFDDYGELWMSQDENPVEYARQYVSDDYPFNDAIVASNTRYIGRYTTPVNRTLVAGKRYWMQMYAGNIGSRFDCSVAITGPDGSAIKSPTFEYAAAWEPPVVIKSRNTRAMPTFACAKQGSCDYNYKESETPVVTSISNTIEAGSDITITGSGFDTNANFMVITVAGEQCETKSSTLTQVICTVSARVPAGTYIPVVSHLLKGKAKNTANTVTVQPVVVSADTNDGFVRIKGNGLAVSPDRLTVSVGGHSCINIEVVGQEIHCAANAAVNAGTTSVAVTISGLQFVNVTDVFNFDQVYIRPGTTTDTKPPVLLTTRGGVSGGFQIEMRFPGWRLTDASKVTVTVDTVKCPVSKSLGTRLSCIAPPMLAGEYAIKVTKEGEAELKMGEIKYLQSVSNFRGGNLMLSPTGGNEFSVSYDVPYDGDVELTYRGVPCKELHRTVANTVQCYLDNKAMSAQPKLPELLKLTPTTQNIDRLIQSSSDVVKTSSGFKIPKAGFLFTRKSFSGSIRITARVTRLDSASSCVLLSGLSPDPTNEYGGVTAYTRGSRYYIGRDNWAPGWAGKEGTEPVVGQPQDWQLDINSGSAIFSINNEVLYSFRISNENYRSGFVGFPTQCQSILVSHIIVSDLTPMTMQLKVAGKPVEMINEPMVALEADDVVFSTIPSFAQNDRDFIVSVINYTGSFELPMFPEDETEFQLTSSTPRLCVGPMSIFEPPIDIPEGTRYLKCVGANVPAGKYMIKPRRVNGGFLKRGFPMTVKPRINEMPYPAETVNMATGGLVRLTLGGVAPSKKGWKITVGSSTCSIEAMLPSKNLIVCRAPPGAGSNILVSANGAFTSSTDTVYELGRNPSKVTGVTIKGRTVTLTGVDLGARGSVAVFGGVECVTYGGRAGTTTTTATCTFDRDMPSVGLHSLTYYNAIESGFASSSSVKLDVKSTIYGNLDVATSGSPIITITGSSIAVTKGLTTVVASRDYSNVKTVPQGEWTVESAIDTWTDLPVYSCQDSYMLGGPDTFSTEETLTRTFNLLASHTHVAVTFDAIFFGYNHEVTGLAVIIDGQENIFYSKDAATLSAFGLTAMCNDYEAAMVRTFMIPHTANSMKLSFRLVGWLAANQRSWGLRSFKVVTGSSQLKASLGNSACSVKYADNDRVKCVAPSGTADSTAEITVTDATCADSCTATFKADKVATITSATLAGIKTTHSKEIHWGGFRGDFKYVNGVSASLYGNSDTRFAGSGASSQEYFTESDLFVGVSATLSTASGLGITSQPLNYVRGSYLYNDYTIIRGADGTVNVYEKGTWKTSSSSFNTGDAMVRITIDPTSKLVSYYVNGYLLYVSRRKVTWPLRITGELDKEGSVTEVTPIFSADPPEIKTGPIVIAGNINSDAVLRVDGKECQSYVSGTNYVICNMPLDKVADGKTVSVTSQSSAGTVSSAVTLTVRPSVSSISTTSGSVQGGHIITVAGGGFTASPVVKLGNAICDVIDFTFGEVRCVTPAGAAGTVEVSVTINSQTAKCVSISRVEYGTFNTDCPTYKYVETTPATTSATFSNGAIKFVATDLPTDSAASCLLKQGSVYQLFDATIESATAAFCIIPSSVKAAGYTVLLTLEATGATTALPGHTMTVPMDSVVTPSKIGNLGGARITVTGKYLKDCDLKSSGSTICDEKISVTETSFVCITKAGDFSSSIQITNGLTSNNVGVTCSSSNNVVISSVSPTAVASGQVLSLSGSNMGGITKITIGEYPCEVIESSTTSASCRVTGIDKGTNSVKVVEGDNGASTAAASVTGLFGVSAVEPARAAIGTIVTIKGSAFENSGTYTVSLGGYPCTLVTFVSASSLTCKVTGPSTYYDGSASVVVTRASTDALTTSPVNFLLMKTTAPTLTSIAPTSGSKAGGTILTLTGDNFDTDPQNIKVEVGETRCLPISASATEVTCVMDSMGDKPAGKYNVQISSKGYPAAETKMFTAKLKVSSITPASPISTEGGVELTINGEGFPTVIRTGVYGLAVTVGYNPCELVSTTETKIVCKVGPSPRPYLDTVTLSSSYTPRPDGEGEVRVSVNGSVSEGSAKVQFHTSATPTITSITPSNGKEVFSGDSLTITGTGFASTENVVELKPFGIGNGTSECTVTSHSATKIVCTLKLAVFGEQMVMVNVPNKGYAKTARSCGAQEFMMCDGSCITEADCSYSPWGYRADCKGLLNVLVDDTYCHSNSGSDRVNKPFILDTGKKLNLNCPMYSCEGKDCNTTITIGGFGGIVSTCGRDPNGYSLIGRGKVTDVSSPTRNSGVHGGLRLTLTGTSLSVKNTVIRIGTDGAFCTPLTANDDGTSLECETSAYSEEVADLTMSVYIGGYKAVCVGCSNFGYTKTVPTVTGFTPSQSNRGTSIAGQTLTISGTGFSTATDKNIVSYGGESCVVTKATTTAIECTMPSLSVGEYSVSVRVTTVGLAAPYSGLMRVRPVITSLSSSAVSIHGGAVITATGSALEGELDLKMGNFPAPTIISHSNEKIVFRTQAGTGSASLIGTVDDTAITCSPSCGISAQAASTPTGTVTEVSGTKLKVASEKIESEAGFTIHVGFGTCAVDAFSYSAAEHSVTCTLPTTNAGGDWPVTVVFDKVGAMGQTTQFTKSYTAHTVTAIAPTAGSIVGGQTVTITGTGFSTETSSLTVTVAEASCKVKSASATEIVCTTSAHAVGSGPVSVTQKALFGQADASGATYQYTLEKTPTITSVKPTRGSTAGGTRLTIQGTKLNAQMTVVIDGVACAIEAGSTSATELICTTGAHATSTEYADIIVTSITDGSAQGSLKYQYIDLWSRWTTWGNNPPPAEGDSAVISEGQTVMYDQTAPRFKLIIVMGHLMFDSEAKDLTLECTYIMINFGRMTIGTPESPFTNKATIRLFGDRLTPEIPVHGSKVLALRHGALDIHGVVRTPTWTKITSHIAVGATSFRVKGPVDWKEREEIVVTSTSFDMEEAEPRIIAKVEHANTNTPTIHVTKPFRFYHNGEKECFSDTSVCIEEIAEVMLLTRNIVVEGDGESQKLGFGGTLFLMPMGESEDRYARLSYTEFRDVGQQYIVGRYPVHFHVTGSSNNSYVNGTSVHRSLNRAYSIHGISNNTYVNNVVYDTHGHAFFIEDGSEKYNVIKNNLVAIARSSTSNLNTDITPACFWVVSPLNYIDGNHAAGCGAYGFWISPFHPHSTGPTYSPSICPSTHQLWHFENNVAHSAKKYGLNIFQFWWPKAKECDLNSDDVPSVIRNHFSWKNRIHGVSVAHSEVGEVGSVSFEKLVSAGNGEEHEDSSAFWIEHIKAPNMTVGLRDSVLIATTKNQPVKPTETRRGVNLPLGDNFFTYDTTFINYNGVNYGFESQRWAERMSFCFPWGWEATSRGLKFVNGDNRIRFRFVHQGVLNDEDGTLAGKAGSQVLPQSSLMDETKCSKVAASIKTVSPSYVCPNDYKVRRYGVNSISDVFNDIIFTVDGRSELVPEIMHKYSMVVPQNKEVFLDFQHSNNPEKWAWTKSPRFAGPNEKVLWATKYKEQRHSVNATFNKRVEEPMDRMPKLEDTKSGYFFDSETGIFKALVVTPDTNIQTTAHTCPEGGCPIEAPNPDALGGPCNYWNLASSWDSGKIPADGTDLVLNYTESICLNEPGKVYRLRSLKLLGKLEVNNSFCNNDPKAKITLIVDKFIHIRGGILQVGTEESPFNSCNFELILGPVDYEDSASSTIRPWSSRSLIVESGTVDLHGEARTKFAQLAVEATVGATTITLDREVDWKVGDTIAISQTRREKIYTKPGSRVEESEVRNITAVSGKTVTFGAALKFTHFGSAPISMNGKEYNIGAEVVHLSRNIKLGGGHWMGQRVEYYHGWNFHVGCTSEMLPACAVGNVEEVGFPMGPKKLGIIRLEGVLLEDIGQGGYTQGSMIFDGLISDADKNDATGSYVKNCAFNRAFNTAIDLSPSTKNMLVENNAFFNVSGDVVRVRGTSNVVDGNVIVYNSFVRPQCTSSYKFNNDGNCIGTAFRIHSGNVVRNNIAASGDGSGFMTIGDDCDKSFSWSGNVAHGRRDGLLVTDNILEGNFPWGPFDWNRACRLVGGITSYSNSDQGIIFWYTVGDAIVSNFTVVDNQFGIAALLFMARPDNGNQEPTFRVENGVVAGRWPNQKCVKDLTFFCRGTVLDSEEWCQTIYGKSGKTLGNIGILEAVFDQPAYTHRTEGEHKNLWIESDSYATLHGRTTVSNVHFDNFDGINECNNMEVAFLNSFYSNDTFHQHTFEKITWGNNVKEGGETYAWTTYGDITGHKTEGEQSVWLDFDNHKFGAYWPDSFNQFWLVDKDGSFTRTGEMTHVVGSQTMIRKGTFEAYGGWDGTALKDTSKLGEIRSECKWSSKWNAATCKGIKYVSVVIESLAEDALTRRAGPVVMCKGDGMIMRNGQPECQGGEVSFASGPVMKGKVMRATLDRMSRWRFNVENNEKYTLYFRGQPPVWIRMWVTNYEYTGLELKDIGVTINLRYFGLNAKLRSGVYVDGQRQRSAFGFGEPQKQNPPATVPLPLSPIGTHYHDKLIENDVERNVMSVTLRPKHAVDLKQEDIVIINMDVSMNIDDFFNNKDTFVGALVQVLGIDPSRVRFANIVAGTKSRHMAAQAAGSSVGIEIEADTTLLQKEAESPMSLIQTDLLAVRDRARGLSGSVGGVNVMNVNAELYVVQVPPPGIIVTSDHDYMILNVTRDGVNKEINETELKNAVLAYTNDMLAASINISNVDIKDIAVGNVYFFAKHNYTRFTLFYLLEDNFAGSNQLSYLLFERLLNGAPAFPKDYRIVDALFYRRVETTDGHAGLSKVFIALLAVGCSLVVAITVGIIVYCCVCRRKQVRKSLDSAPQSPYEVEHAPDHNQY